jgi:hypothetical protein
MAVTYLLVEPSTVVFMQNQDNIRVERMLKTLNVGERLQHANLGVVTFSPEAAAMQAKNPDPVSLFVEFQGEVREVTATFVSRIH